MLNIIIICFIGKYYYELTQDYYKNRWIYGILGIVVYYIGAFSGGIVIGITDNLFDIGFNWNSTSNLIIISLLFGLLFKVLVYGVLYRKWKKAEVVAKNEISDIGKNESN
ncbi:hypothetical protein [Jejuia spongiicola]|uniref:Uncharacterized protein n=1 Tax=Jejuia spongiicola TaxID=2942207 RepID=A0ABT0QBS0_9FLAO|nr:hypothetical protein [Jejuia spongiicola]MCL6294403.1 hypothetical protein [Jejuia spongiicola]